MKSFKTYYSIITSSLYENNILTIVCEASAIDFLIALALALVCLIGD
jgi:hypothetical protein